MKIHLTTKGTRCYQDDQTGREYRFEWGRFWEAAHDAADRGSSISKVEARLAEAAHISEEAVRNHLRVRGSRGANFPADIGIIRSYGTALTGNEDAFLQPLAPAERPSPTSAEELKRQGEEQRAELEYGLESLKYEDDVRQIIPEVFSALWEILSLYEISDGYNFRPDTAGLEGAEEYFDAMLGKVRETVKPLETPRGGPGPHYRRWPVNRLLRLLDETESFVKSYSVPGADPRWRKVNPRLNYYDPSFDLVEELPPEAYRRLWDMFGCRPTQWDLQMRRRYFSGLEEQWDGAARAYFQRELLDTLVKLFQHDFIE